MYIYILPQFSLRQPIKRPAGWKHFPATKSAWSGSRIADYSIIPQLVTSRQGDVGDCRQADRVTSDRAVSVAFVYWKDGSDP
jgi:hypothetical protein